MGMNITCQELQDMGRDNMLNTDMCQQAQAGAAAQNRCMCTDQPFPTSEPTFNPTPQPTVLPTPGPTPRTFLSSVLFCCLLFGASIVAEKEKKGVD
jgi:hypothetical protein